MEILALKTSLKKSLLNTKGIFYQDKFKDLASLVILFVGMTYLFLSLVIKNNSFYPFVMYDEWSYSNIIGLAPLTAAKLPNYLYFLVYKLTAFSGDGFQSSVKLFNVIFYVSTVPLIYIVAKEVTSKILAAWIAVFTLLAPLKSITAYVMPESMYLFGFWVLVISVVVGLNKPTMWHWLGAGVANGLLALVKPHALFLIPGIVLLVVFVKDRGEKKWFVRNLSFCLWYLAALIIVRFGLGYLIGGQDGLSIFGESYTTGISAKVSNSISIVDILDLGIKNALKHVLTIVLMFALPAAVLLKIVFFENFENEIYGRKIRNLGFLTLVVFVSLVGVTAVFTASMVGHDGITELNRLHQRYYNFAFPLFSILVLGLFKQKPLEVKSINIILIIIVATMTYFGIRQYQNNIFVSFIDNPEYFCFTFNPSIYTILWICALVSLVLFLYHQKAAAIFYLFVFLPFFSINGLVQIDNQMGVNSTQDVYDRAGLFVRDFIQKDDYKDLELVGDSPFNLYRANMLMNSINVEKKLMPKGSVFDIKDADPSKKWLVGIGDISIVGDANYRYDIGGITLVKLTDNINIDFTKNQWLGDVKLKSGFSQTEPWGTWSVGKTVVLQFRQKLPNNFELVLRANAFGPNVGKPVEITVGTQKQKLSFPSDAQTGQLDFLGTGGSEDTITFTIPEPKSPKSLGINPDSRELGIGFTNLAITKKTN